MREADEAGTGPVRLASFGTDLTALVVGATGGLGAAFVRLLAASPDIAAVVAASRSGGGPDGPAIRKLRLDLEDEASIAAAAEAVGAPDLVIVATGLLHDAALQPEKSWRALEPAALERAFRINATGPALLAKHLLPLLPRDRKSAFAALSAKVGSIEDNRAGGWHAYRASKAALNMLVRTLAIELALRRPKAICVALHPGTVATPLSAPFRTSISHDRVFAPDYSARRLLGVLDGLGPEDSGRLVGWDGQRLPF